jgi:soluble lytic murein transglycosylase-like protein
MAGYTSARRPLRTVALVVLLPVVASFALQARDAARTRVPKQLPLRNLTLPQDEIADLAKVAEWLGQPENTRRPAAELVEEIRNDRDSFAVFAGFHTEQERREALVDIPFGRQIAVAARLHQVDSLLVASVVEVESTFRPSAGSPKGAVGLMQLLPSTAGLSRAKLKNPDTNLDAGAAYLSQMIERFDGDLSLALAAYNAGPTNVRRYNGVPPFPETQQYVEKVLSRYVDHHRALWHTSGAAELIAVAAVS